MFYEAGTLYYTIAGHTSLYSRPFSPDSGAVGAIRTTVPTPGLNFGNCGGMFISGGKFYVANRVSGDLARMDWVNGAPSGTLTMVSGPASDKQDWRAKVIFVGP